MTNIKLTPIKDCDLPFGYLIVRLQNLNTTAQKKLLPQVFKLTKEQYPEWPAENTENWLNALNGGNENGTKMAASVVLNPLGNPVGLSALELYKNGTAMINYSVASKASDNYFALIHASTKDMMAGIRELQAHGETINFVGKEHHLQSDRAIAGYHAVGQVPIDGPTSLLSTEVKYYEVAYGDPKDLKDHSKVSHALKLADSKTGVHQDEVVHLWLIQDFTPSHPDKPLADSLRELAETYTLEHSIYRENNYRLDPAYLSLNKLADSLPPLATYQQAVKASAVGAAAFMGLQI